MNPLAIPRVAPPVPGGKICGRYMPSWKPDHRAIDFCAPKGTPIISVRPGVVVLVADTPHGGNNLIIRHDNGLHTYYAHCDRILVREGQQVKRYQQVAVVGATGSPNPGVIWIDPHLHMQVMAGQSFSSVHYSPLDFLAQNGIEERDGVMYWKPGYPQSMLARLASPTVFAGLTLVGLGTLAGYYFWTKAKKQPKE